MVAVARNATGPFACKSIEALQADAASHGLRRTLGPLHLVLFGIGCILGAGIYVLPGTAAANFAGPAVMISFVLAGTACALTALCYAELASTMPVSGSSYSYCYAAIGEVFAWGLGWILMLEYTLASSTLAVGFSSYLASLLRDFDIMVPPFLATPTVGAAGGFSVNLLAVLALLPKLAFADSSSPDAAKVARGKYLVSTSACHDCHTPWKMGENGPEPDFSRMLSGHPENLVMPPPPARSNDWTIAAGATMTAWSGPWGMSFTANLTPDPDTGLGRWTFQNFRDTIRTGRHMGRGRPILPPMPIPVYRNFSDEDLEAIFAYLQTIPPVKNRVPEPLPPPEASRAAPQAPAGQ